MLCSLLFACIADDNVTDDFALEHFDHALAYDHQRVIPMIKRAMTTAADAWDEPIKLFASPWSPQDG